MLKIFSIVTLSARKDHKLLWYYGKTGSLEQASSDQKAKERFFSSDDKTVYEQKSEQQWL